MRKAIFIFIISVLLLHAKCVAQNNTVYGAGISYTNGIPTFVPPSRSARVAIDTVTSKWYEYATPGGWRFAGDRIQRVSGCSAPSYTPTKAQSWIVINGCTEAQNGQGPELYYYTGSNWIFINEKSTAPTYTAGTGIGITGDVITNTGDLSNTNELQTLSSGTNTVTLSNGGGTVTVDTDPTNDITSLSGGTGISVSGSGNSRTITNTGDLSATNELQTISISGSDITLSNGGGTVSVPGGGSDGNGIYGGSGTVPDETVASVSGSFKLNNIANTVLDLNFTDYINSNINNNIGVVCNPDNYTVFGTDEDGNFTHTTLTKAEGFKTLIKQTSGGMYQSLTSEIDTSYTDYSVSVNSIVFTQNRAGNTKEMQFSALNGLAYTDDYSAAIKTNDRSIPDVGTVKQLIKSPNVWTTATRPTPAIGEYPWGFNTTTNKHEGWNGTTWNAFY